MSVLLSSALLLLFRISTANAQPHAAPPAVADKKPQRAVGGADCSRTTGYDAIVVGAGLAGLSAARELAHLGHSVLILEANDRIGGRAYVGEIGDQKVPIDYGGAWIHGISTNPLTALVDSLGFQRTRTELDAPFYVNGQKATGDQLESFEQALHEYEGAAERAAAAGEQEYLFSDYACKAAGEIQDRRMQPKELCTQLARGLPDKRARHLCDLARRIVKNVTPRAFCEEAEKSIRTTSDIALDYIPRDPRFQSVLPLLIANAGPLETAAELKNSSAVDASQFAAGEDDLIDKGLGAFVTKFGENVPACLNSPVERMDYSEGRVVVEAAGRRYQARKAVVTVSAGVLAANKIAFHPELPAWKQDAIRNLQMGNMQKVIIPFSRDVFGDTKPNSWILAEDRLLADEREFAEQKHLPTDRRVMAFVIKPLGANIAIGFFGGDWARALESQCDGKENDSGVRSKSGCDGLSIRIATAALGNIYGAEVAGAILSGQIHLTRWSLDPTSFGAYSVPVPGHWDKHEVLRRPIGPGKDGEGASLFFAGEGTARAIYNGSYPGAYESGLEAARAVHAELEKH